MAGSDISEERLRSTAFISAASIKEILSGVVEEPHTSNPSSTNDSANGRPNHPHPSRLILLILLFINQSAVTFLFAVFLFISDSFFNGTFTGLGGFSFFLLVKSFCKKRVKLLKSNFFVL